MIEFTTSLMSVLFKGESIDEFFRGELKSAIKLIKLGLPVYLDFEKPTMRTINPQP
jgi:hypothetical protein